MAEEPEVRRAYADVKLCPQSSEVIIHGKFPFTLGVLLSVLKHFLYFLSKQNPSDTFRPIFYRIMCIFTCVYIHDEAN